MAEEEGTHFSSELAIIVYARPRQEPKLDWQEVDRGPGYFTLAPDQEIAVRIKGIDDTVLVKLVQELRGVEALHFLDLSENRNVTNESMPMLGNLTQLHALNLSSCSITNLGLVALKELPYLERLNLSYCNRLSDAALKTLESMRSLEFVDLQGCVSITQGGLARVRRKNLRIHIK